MRGYLVDPFAKTVTEVETTGYPHFKELIGVQTICAVDVWKYTSGRDTMWIDDDGLYVDGQAFFLLSTYHQPLAGKGILLGTDEEGETVGARMELDTFKPMVSFPNIEFAGLEMIPPHKEVHPYLGEVNVVGSHATFRPKSEKPSDE